MFRQIIHMSYLNLPYIYVTTAEKFSNKRHTQCKQAVEFCEDMLSAYNIAPSFLTPYSYN